MASPRPALPEVIETARIEAVRQRAALVGLAAAVSAGRFGVSTQDVFVRTNDRKSAQGTALQNARDLTVWLLHCGMGWTVEQAGQAINIDSRQAAQRALRRVSDLEEGHPSFSRYLEELADLLAMQEAG